MATYKIKGSRFLRKYTSSVAEPTYAAAIQAQNAADALCGVEWERSDYAGPAEFTSHDNATLDENVANRERFDAALFCAGHEGDRHRAYANAAFYLFKLPAAAEGVSLTSVTVKAASDPYNSPGLRIAVHVLSSAELPTACATVRSGDGYVEGAVPRTASGEGAALRWYAAQGDVTVEPTAATNLMQYLAVFVGLENYATSRDNWLEGSGVINPVVTLTTGTDIDGLDADEVNDCSVAAAVDGVVRVTGYEQGSWSQFPSATTVRLFPGSALDATTKHMAIGLCSYFSPYAPTKLINENHPQQTYDAGTSLVGLAIGGSEVTSQLFTGFGTVDSAGVGTFKDSIGCWDELVGGAIRSLFTTGSVVGVSYNSSTSFGNYCNCHLWACCDSGVYLLGAIGKLVFTGYTGNPSMLVFVPAKDVTISRTVTFDDGNNPTITTVDGFEPISTPGPGDIYVVRVLSTNDKDWRSALVHPLVYPVNADGAKISIGGIGNVAVDGVVTGIAAYDDPTSGRFVVSGDFKRVGGVECSHVAVVDVRTGRPFVKAAPFDAPGFAPNAYDRFAVRRVGQLSTPTWYAIGAFTKLAGTACAKGAAAVAEDGTVTALDTYATDVVATGAATVATVDAQAVVEGV